MPRRNKVLNIGDSCAAVTLRSAHREEVSLESYRDKQHIILKPFSEAHGDPIAAAS